MQAPARGPFAARGGRGASCPGCAPSAYDGPRHIIDRFKDNNETEGEGLELGTLFSELSSATAVSRFIKSLLKNTRGTKRSLLLELQKNINLIYLYTKGGAPIERVIERLEVARYEAAVQSNFDFGSLKHKRLQKRTVEGAPQFGPYVGWTTEQLFENIYLKIHTLKSIVAIDTKGDKFRKNVRLINILKLMLLLLKHIKS